MNGHDPFSFPIAELIPTDALTAETIHPFYCKGIDHKTVRASLRYMKLIKQFFTAPCPVKYRIIDVLMKLSGKYVSFKGLMHQRTDNLACTKSNKGLLERFDNAIDIAVSMIYSFDESLQTKTALNERFDRTFE